MLQIERKGRGNDEFESENSSFPSSSPVQVENGPKEIEGTFGLRAVTKDPGVKKKNRKKERVMENGRVNFSSKRQAKCVPVPDSK